MGYLTKALKHNDDDEKTFNKTRDLVQDNKTRKKRQINRYNFVQEIMVSSKKARLFFGTFLPGWEKIAIDSSSQSGSLLYERDPRKGRFTPFHTVEGILMVGNIIGF